MRGLNFRAALATEDLEYLAEVYTQEILERTKAFMGASGSAATGATSYGIVDSLDPAVFVGAGDTSTRPLRASINTTNSLLIDVTPGLAFGLDGELFMVTQRLLGLSLPSTTIGLTFVISLKRVEVDNGHGLTDFNTDAALYRVRPGEDPSANVAPTASAIAEAERGLIEFLTEAAFLALNSEDRKLRVPLGVVRVESGTAGAATLVLDTSRSSYTFNRPWFSSADIYHRSRIGSGVVTDENPHGTALSNMAVGDITPIQLWTPEGVVVAKSNDYARLPGFKCEETIPVGQLILDDTAGTISGIPAAAGVRTRLAKISHYPIRLLRIVATVIGPPNGTEISGMIVPGTALIAIPPHEVQWLSSGDLVITTTAATAGEPPTGDLVAGASPTDPPTVGANLTSLTFQQPVAGRREQIISHGLEFSQIDTPTQSLLVYGTIPINGRAILDGNGDVQLLPQPIVCQTRLDSVSSAVNAVGKSPLGPSRLRAALTGAAAGAAMAITIQVIGEDRDGSAVTENFTFSGGALPGGTWADNPAPSCEELSTQFAYWATGTQQLSENVFSKITSWQVISRVADGLNSAVAIYAEPDSNEAALRDAMPLCSFTWDGNKTCSLRDERPVALTGIAPHSSAVIAEGVARARGLTGALAPDVFYIEDFREPRFLDATQSTLDAGFDGCRGRNPDGVITKGTYVSRPLIGVTDPILAPDPLTNVSITIFAIPDQQHPGHDLSACIESMTLRVYQGQAAGAYGATVVVAAPYFNAPIGIPSLPGADNAVNRVQIFIRTNEKGNLLKGIAIAICSN